MVILFTAFMTYSISVVVALVLSFITFSRKFTSLTAEDYFFYVYFSVIPIVNIMHIFGIIKDLREGEQR